MTKWLLLGGAILSEVSASLSLKGALDRPALYAVVIVGFTAAFLFLRAVLQRGMGLGVAYGIWGALGVALTAALSAVIYDEPITTVMVIGLGFIIAGVLTVELGSQKAHRDAIQNGAA